MGQRFAATGTCVLLVESSAIIGLDLADDLESHGYAVEGPLACAAAAQWLETRTPDLAILDVDLQSGMCVALARELRAREVPILIFSAHDRAYALEEFRSLPWLAMPASKHALHSALHELCAGVPA